MGRLLALVLAIVAAIFVFNAVGGGILGFALGALAFIVTGWVVALLVPLAFGVVPRSGARNKQSIANSGLIDLERGETYVGDIPVVHLRDPGANRSMGFFAVTDFSQRSRES